MNIKERFALKQGKKDLKKMNNATLYNAAVSSPAYQITLGTCAIACAPNYPQKADCRKKEEKENTMRISTEVNLDAQRISYLNSRVYEHYHTKMEELIKHFAIRDDERPTKAEDLVKRIQEGKFILPTDKEVKLHSHYYGDDSILRVITWRDPAKQADQAGFDKAREALDEAHASTKDVIMVKSADEGLKAVEDFKARTFH